MIRVAMALALASVPYRTSWRRRRENGELGGAEVQAACEFHRALTTRRMPDARAPREPHHKCATFPPDRNDVGGSRWPKSIALTWLLPMRAAWA